MNRRVKKAKQIMLIDGYCSQINRDNFLVKSQAIPQKEYLISNIGERFVCECADFITTEKDCKHIKVVLEVTTEPKPTPMMANRPKPIHTTNARQQRAKQIMTKKGHASQITLDQFKVRSQTDPSKFYIIKRTDNGLVCECPDHQERKADCKHIKVILEHIRKNVFSHDGFRIIERSIIKVCKFCDSGNIIKKGFKKNKSGKLQKFKCNDCKRGFTINFGFEKKQFDESIITQTMQMYYSKMSVRRIADHFEMIGIDVSFKTIYNWISQYSEMTSKYLDGIVPRTNGRTMVRADEVWVKIAGEQKYLFASMDDDTRYWLASDMAETKFQHNADNLLKLTKEKIGKSPAHFVTDGLPAYMKSSKKVFGKQTKHIRHIHIAGKRDRDNNNKMERLNGEIRDREKVFRGLKKMDTPLIDGMKVYYNFTKKHGALKGQTPAQASMIEVDGKNKWKTIIQNASLSKNYE